MLTLKQKLEDHEYFWHILDTCFPVKAPAARVGIDWEAARESSRRAVEESKDDLEFFRAMEGAVNCFKEEDRERFFCHLRIFEPARYRAYQKMFTAFKEGAWENEEARNGLAPWLEPLFQERSELFYSQFEERAKGIHLKGQAPELLPENFDPVFGEDALNNNVEFEIIEEGKIAKITVHSLNMMCIKGDRPLIFDFYKSIEGYEHLIVDFRDNGGGATDYWQRLLVAPTIREPLHISTYMGYNINDNNRRFIPGERTPISELPDLPGLVKEDIAALTHFDHASYRVEPDPEHNHFNGKVWVLLSKTVYSSAESFACFCRHSGWCTTIGSRTGGDGLGITPFHYCMPNSGIVWRFSGEYGINPDGSSNQTDCTLPHIVCDSEKALEVCLEEIKKYGK